MGSSFLLSLWLSSLHLSLIKATFVGGPELALPSSPPYLNLPFLKPPAGAPVLARPTTLRKSTDITPPRSTSSSRGNMRQRRQSVLLDPAPAPSSVEDYLTLLAARRVQAAFCMAIPPGSITRPWRALDPLLLVLVQLTSRRRLFVLGVPPTRLRSPLPSRRQRPLQLAADSRRLGERRS